MCETPMEIPKFKEGETAEHWVGGDVWERVAILSRPLRFADSRITVGNVYLVGDGKVGFLTNECKLRRVECWKSCSGKHRLAPGDFRHHPDGASGPWERLVE